jgi:hypothetical protein
VATDGWNEPQANCELNSAGEGASVWWRWTAPRSGTLDVNTNGTDYDTVLSIWNGCGQYTAAGGFDADSILACDDDSGTGTQSQILNFPVQIGETYYFKVSSYDDGTAGGLADFAFVLTPTAPANDTCASPTTIPGAAYGTYAPALLDTDRATISLCEHDGDVRLVQRQQQLRVVRVHALRGRADHHRYLRQRLRHRPLDLHHVLRVRDHHQRQTA